ncbi:NlpC/P60 family protein [Pseudobacillus sp. 179-B 2D1 NHS]|uniref:NlpC/P60 family protein n=1 Tax=Pseudobacillus sp. 179-B 2D1 NHS TaxID=3374292 RepID=UPI0038790ED0
MPCTWLGWNYSGCTGTKGRGSNIPKNTLLNPSMIAKYGGYGVDANGDGKADPMQIEDAIHATANYLKASGMPGNPKKAIRRYNHSDKYVNDVMSYAAKFRAEASTAPNPATTTTASASKKGSLMNSFSFVSRAYANSSANYQSGWKATAYAPALGGINGGSTTASGTKVVNGRTIAVDPKLIPLGSIVAIKVPNMPKYNGVYVAEDTGGAIKNKKIDIAIAPGQVKAFGVKSIQVAILKRGSGVKDAKKTVATWSTSKAKWEQLAGVASSSNTDNGPYGVNNGTFPLPKGQYDKFGDSWGNDRTYGGNRRHEGNDIMAKSGVKIYSATDGVVEKHGWNKLGGWRLNIKSPDGYNLYYAHMLKYAPGISKGVKVKRGQLIGYVGATGYGPQGTTGKFDPHLHFGIYKNGKAINPYPFLKAWEKGEQILDDSSPYASCGTDEGGESSELGSGNATGKAADVLKAGEKWLGRPYKWGGGRTDATVAKGLFDCSGFVHYAFSQVGINLGPRNSVSTDTLKKLQKKIPASQMQPGDLVFFDTDKTDGHVGIYAGNGKFLGSQTSTGVAYADMSKGYWKNKFNGRVIRVLK